MRDDVFDAPSRLPADPLLRRALLECDRVVRPAFDQADASALRHQKRHRRIVVVATVLGTVSIMAALALDAVDILRIRENSVVNEFQWLRTWGGFIVAIAVVIGVASQLQYRWYLQRHIAERLCLLKYAALLRFCSQVDGEASIVAWQEWLADEVRKICGLDTRNMIAWAAGIVTPAHLPPLELTETRRRLAAALHDYYCAPTRRLRLQEEYFHKRARQYGKTDRRLRAAVPILLLGGVLLSLLYLEYPLFSWDVPTANHMQYIVGAVLSVAAAWFVALGAMVRILRTSDEYARNTMRFSAVYRALEALGRRLAAAQEPQAIVQGISDVEAILEDEHREWLRLMVEADWH